MICNSEKTAIVALLIFQGLPQLVFDHPLGILLLYESLSPTWKFTLGYEPSPFLGDILEGMFTIVLYADVETKEKDGSKKLWNHFVTQNTGDTTAKSPMGMFSELKIDNDLKTVVDTINEYYGRGSQN